LKNRLPVVKWITVTIRNLKNRRRLLRRRDRRPRCRRVGLKDGWQAERGLNGQEREWADAFRAWDRFCESRFWAKTFRKNFLPPNFGRISTQKIPDLYLY
jgi:hypothetical protein